jgi:hypothetical protein
VDLHNIIARVIRPHVEGSAYLRNNKPQECVRCSVVPKASGVRWKTLYAGRRGAATALIEKSNGNLALGQALLRHKSQITTANFYKKQITPQAFKDGMKLLEAAANGKKPAKTAKTAKTQKRLKAVAELNRLPSGQLFEVFGSEMVRLVSSYSLATAI